MTGDQNATFMVSWAVARDAVASAITATARARSPPHVRLRAFRVPITSPSEPSGSSEIAGYRPDFLPVPRTYHVDLELTREEARLVSALQSTGTYGQTEGEVVRAVFMRWWNSNRLLARRPKLLFRSRP